MMAVICWPLFIDPNYIIHTHLIFSQLAWEIPTPRTSCECKLMHICHGRFHPTRLNSAFGMRRTNSLPRGNAQTRFGPELALRWDTQQRCEILPKGSHGSGHVITAGQVHRNCAGGEHGSHSSGFRVCPSAAPGTSGTIGIRLILPRLRNGPGACLYLYKTQGKKSELFIRHVFSW